MCLCISNPFTVTQSETPVGRIMDGDEGQMTAKAGVMLLGSQLLFSLPSSGVSFWVGHIHTCTFLVFGTQGNAAARSVFNHPINPCGSRLLILIV